ncbi:helix-turn-helix domain-containing protein [Microbulbifer sp. OS29]|uniref:Helix-turn-helix domain-containing protein n=1 Tax=Microbulbifer okhotskensis TaxID=2926617 RepID=A0A9X2ERR6_9GAMM|nr:helix-turn-helix transcriptional regulator [Microbulbifer okhotskensis]MCO1336596.1 helix-turn-helix domain-containing protein [Microbulbifer okhotskensis]
MKSSPYSPDVEKLRKWLKQKREEQGLSIRAAAAMLGRHHSIIGKIEQERKKIDILEFAEYCAVLNADPHEGLDILLNSLRSRKKI